MLNICVKMFGLWLNGCYIYEVRKLRKTIKNKGYEKSSKKRSSK